MSQPSANRRWSAPLAATLAALALAAFFLAFPAAGGRLLQLSGGLVVETVREHPVAVVVGAGVLGIAGWVGIAAAAWWQTKGR